VALTVASERVPVMIALVTSNVIFREELVVIFVKSHFV